MLELLLGLDVGTTNVKAVLATPDGAVVARAQRGYPTRFPKPGWAEQDPEAWWRAAAAVIREVLAHAGVDPAAVAGIGVSGQGCAVTLLGGSGEVLRPAIIWMDSRAEPQSERLRRTCAADILELNGKSPAPYNADPTLMWLHEHEPETVARAAWSLTTTGYLNYRLTGRAVTNPSDASILFGFDLRAGGWSDALIAAFGLPRRLYPEILPCTQVIGGLCPGAAAELGLRAGTPVVAGGEDTSSAALAVGAVQPGQVIVSLGTAGTLYAAAPAAPSVPVHPDLLTFLHVVPGRSLIGGSLAAVGAALDWLARVLELPPDEVLALAAQSDAGAGGLLFLPYLGGELQPINDGHARGVFIGLAQSSEQRHLARAVLEGTAFALAHNLSVAAEAGAATGELRAVGGPTRSPFWCQLIADVAGRPLHVCGDNPGAPLGNALLAGAGAGLVCDVGAVAARAARVTRTFVPRPELRGRYDGLFGVYRGLYPSLKGAFLGLAALESA